MGKLIGIIFLIVVLVTISGIIVFLSIQHPERRLDVGANIEEIKIEDNYAYITLSGGANDKEIERIKFIFTDNYGVKHYYSTTEGIENLSKPYKKSIVNLFKKPDFQGTYRYIIDSNEIGFENFDRIYKIEIVFDYKKDILEVDKDVSLDSEVINEDSAPSDGGGGGSSFTPDSDLIPTPKAYWMYGGNEVVSLDDMEYGATLKLVLKDSGLNPGIPVEFMIYERDFFEDDYLAKLSKNVGSDGYVYVDWIITEAHVQAARNLLEGNKLELYFEVRGIKSGILKIDFVDKVIVSASDFENVPDGFHPPEYTIDNNLSEGSRWSADGEQWIRYDLPNKVSINTVSIMFLHGDERQAIIDIEISEDGKSWTQVFSGSSSGTNSGFEAFTFSESTVSSIRILGHGNTDSSWNSFIEVNWSNEEIIIPPPVTGDVYYVSNSGNDNNDGLSESTPWQTIAKVSSMTFNPGDAILFKRGNTWREQLIMSSSGNSTDYILFSSYGGGNKPKILGSEQSVDWTHLGNNIWRSSTEVVDPTFGASHGGDEKGYGHQWPGSLWYVENDGSVTWGHMQKYATESDFSNLTEEYDWVWIGEETLGSLGNIHVYSTESPGTRYNSLESATRQSCIDLDNKEYLEFDNLELQFAAAEGIGEDWPGTELHGLIVKNSKMSYFAIKDGVGYGVHLHHSDLHIYNNIIHDAGRRSISLQPFDTVEDIVFENVIVENNTLYNGFHTTGIDIGHSGNNIYRNFHLRNNLIYDDPYASLTSPEGWPSNGIFIGNHGTGPFEDFYIYNNVIIGSSASGIQVCCDGGGPKEVYIYHNTFYGVNKNEGERGANAFLRIEGEDTDVTIRNNILYNDAQASNNYANLFVYHTETAHIDNNLHYIINPDVTLAIVGTSYDRYYIDGWYDEYISNTGYDVHSPFPADPLFVDQDNGNFNLVQYSVAIDVGAIIPGINNGYYGNAPDIGAFEYAGTETGGSFITIHAAGVPDAGIYPIMELIIDGITVSSWTVNSGDPNIPFFAQYSYSYPGIISSSNTVRVAYTNDDSPVIDLRVDKIVIDGTTYETEDPSTFNTGTWDGTSCGGDPYAESEWLHCSGYFEYDLGGPCQYDADCFDGNSCTTDSCVSGSCDHTPYCSSADGICCSGCTSANDDDCVVAPSYIIADHNAADAFENIPDCWVEEAKSQFIIGYGFTSHGTQVTSGLWGLNDLMNDAGSPNDLYYFNNGGTNGALDLERGDGYGCQWLDHDVGYTPWLSETRNYLDGYDPGCPPDEPAVSGDHSDVNTIMWSWCGQVNDVNLQTHYFDNVVALESEYPGITFIYMTGHLESNQAVLSANNQIRQHVQDVNGILFDFADIEKWDPAGQEHPWDTDACNWCSDWCANSEDCTSILNAISGCAHSHEYNCYRKAKAFWWMMARIAGWDGVSQNCPVSS